MKKTIFVLSLAVFLILSAKEASASIILIDKNGEIVWKVLSSESSVALAVPKQSLLVKDVADLGSADEEISLNRDEGKVSLRVGEENLDVTNLGNDLVEIEERGETKRVEIGLQGDKFSIIEGGITVLTSLSININPTENRLSIVTSTGEKFLNILPFEAAQVALRSRYLTKIDQKTFDLTEENKDISYSIAGQRVINVFNLIKLDIPVQTKVSASTGEILTVEQPTWLKVLGFVFS
jgi:hypothetical protein